MASPHELMKRFEFRIKITTTAFFVFQCLVFTSIGPVFGRLVQELNVTLPPMAQFLFSLSDYWWSFLGFTAVNTFVLFRTNLLNRPKILLLEFIFAIIGFFFALAAVMIPLLPQLFFYQAILE